MGIEGVRGLVADLSAGLDQLAAVFLGVPAVEGVALSYGFGQLTVSVTEDNGNAAVLKHASAGVEGYIDVDDQLLGAAVALAVAVRVGVVSVFVSGIPTGRTRFRSPVLRVRAVCPTAVRKAVIRIVVGGITAVAASLSPAMLRAVVVLPAAIRKGMALIRCRTDVAVTGGAVVHDAVLGRGVLLVFLARIVPVVFIFALAAVTAVGVAAVLAGTVILPDLVAGSAVADTVVHQVAAVLAELIPVAAVPFAVRPVVVADVLVAAVDALTVAEGVFFHEHDTGSYSTAGTIDAVQMVFAVLRPVVCICVSAVSSTSAVRYAAVR